VNAPAYAPKIEFKPVASLTPYPRNARRHSKKQVKQIAASIERFGFTNPILLGDSDEIIAGHGRAAAAKLLGLQTVPTIALAHLTPAERRAYMLADNKLALNAQWDPDMLAMELQGLIELDFDLELTGFMLAETDIILEEAKERRTKGTDAVLDAIPPLPAIATTKRSDIWLLGNHRLICGDAREALDYDRLMGNERADLVFTDPPYNVPVNGHVGGLGRIQHREFIMASGEMNQTEFTNFLTSSLSRLAGFCQDGAIAFVCMDWRHMGELLEAGGKAFAELKNLCVWNKRNGGMGSFYRSKHELIFVYKVGNAPHINSFELGQHGRYRTNVWDYAGISSLGAGRDEELAMHPTVKPVALVADAIKDCSKRGGLVLDAFGGSGSTLIAAESCGRLARLIEYDPLYCDTIITRWQALTGKEAILASSRHSFEDEQARQISEAGA
jgi:DNA modification methylase